MNSKGYRNNPFPVPGFKVNVFGASPFTRIHLIAWVFVEHLSWVAIVLGSGYAVGK